MVPLIFFRNLYNPYYRKIKFEYVRRKKWILKILSRIIRKK